MTSILLQVPHIQTSIITKRFHIPVWISSQILDKYFLRRWSNSYFFGVLLNNSNRYNEQGYLHYQGTRYKVVYLQEPIAIIESKALMLSFRKPKDTSIHPIVLVKPYIPF